MQKISTIFVCSNCGNEATKWFGKCPACNQWNTCYEEKTNKKSGIKNSDKKQAKPTLLNDVQKQNITRNSTGFEELDRVLRRRTGKWFFNFTTVENQELVNLHLSYKYAIKCKEKETCFMYQERNLLNK